MEFEVHKRKRLFLLVGAILAVGILYLWWNIAQQPKELPAMPDSPYVSAADWPPQLREIGESFTCAESGLPVERAGGTEERKINGRIYCVTEVTEGTAGSVYTQYAYAFEKGESTAILTYSIRFVQCGNFDESERTDCEREQEAFDPDRIADAYAYGRKND